MEQQRPDFGVVFQPFKHVFLVGRLQFADQVGGLVRLHLIDDARQRLARQGRGQVGGVLVVEFF